MIKEEAAETLKRKDPQEARQWVVTLGWNLTVAARSAYPQVQGEIAHLVGFNEMQHQLYNFLRHPSTSDRWTIANLLDGLCSKAEHYGINADLNWAVERSFASS